MKIKTKYSIIAFCILIFAFCIFIAGCAKNDDVSTSSSSSDSTSQSEINSESVIKSKNDSEIVSNSENDSSDSSQTEIIIDGEETAYLGQVIDVFIDYDGEESDLEFSISDPTVINVRYVEQTPSLYLAYIESLSLGESIISITSKVSDSFRCNYKINVIKEDLVYLNENDLIKDITVENTDGELYKDDTTARYKITTDKSVNKLELIVIDSDDGYTPFYDFNDVLKVREKGNVCEIYSLIIDDTTLSETRIPYETGKNGKIYSATKEETADSIIWTVEWNLGNTAVNFVEINAYGVEDKKESAYANLDIHYPKFDATKGLEPIINTWIKANIDGPLYFEFDYSQLSEEYRHLYFEERLGTVWLDDEIAVLMGLLTSRSEMSENELKKLDDVDNDELYNYMFDASPIYRGHYISDVCQYYMVAPIETMDSEELYKLKQSDEPVLATYFRDFRTYAYYYPITDDIRAVIAYQNGFEIDEKVFPIAHSVLERATAVLDEIITDDMTDFEKEKAIYSWMVSYQSEQTADYSQLSSDELYYATKTAYGFLNGYGGDCMGYSATFFTLCNMVGVDCSVVDVRAINEGEVGGASEGYSANHRINLVRLDGEYYFVEAFWFYQKANDSEGDFRFMNMTSEKASKYYKWKTVELFGPVECDYSTYLVDEHTGELLNKN